MDTDHRLSIEEFMSHTGLSHYHNDDSYVMAQTNVDTATGNPIMIHFYPIEGTVHIRAQICRSAEGRSTDVAMLLGELNASMMGVSFSINRDRYVTINILATLFISDKSPADIISLQYLHLLTALKKSLHEIYEAAGILPAQGTPYMNGSADPKPTQP